MNLKPITPLMAALGLAVAGSAHASPDTDTSTLFALTDLGSGQALNLVEGGCGAGSGGEGKCGIEHLDTDGDGRVSRDEFQAAGKPMAMFDQIDTDGDGFLSAEELRVHHAARHAHADEAEGACGEGKCGEGRCGGTA
ncbi:MAG: EF-hand domain-containing protein [Xanthomonadales bacterium]|nr:EF-hand domain-containing protein [Xanthomonadales bacterium]